MASVSAWAALATAHDVARAAGVSQATVSRAFTPGSRIADSTRSRIFAVAAQLGYRPNQIARSLTSGQSNLVGIGIENLHNPFFSETVEAMSLELAKAGLRLMLFTIGTGDDDDTPVQDALRYRLDALVLVSTTLSSALASQCRAARVPVILYNRTNRDGGLSSVTGDNDVGARTLAAFLLAGGHRRFAFMAGVEDSSTSLAREYGFTDYLVEQGMAAPIRDSGGFTYAGAAAATRRLLAARDRPDAIFCANDHMATAAIDVAQHEFGIDVGRELSIVGFDDILAARRPAYALTTFSQPSELMVRATVDIISRLRAGESDPIHRVVEGELIVRTSARRPPAYRARSEGGGGSAPSPGEPTT